MPKLPQFTARLSEPNLNSAQVDPRYAAMPSTALGNLGEAMTQTAGMAAQMIDERKRQDGAKWGAENHSVFTRKVAEWMDQNDDREDYGEAFQKFADGLSKTMSESAPNSYAKDAFERASRAEIDQKYFSALKIGERNRYNTFKFSEQEAAVANAVSFRSYSQQDPEGAAQLVRFDLDTQHQRVNGSYAKTPAIASDILESTTADTITGVMETNPELALELLDEYPLNEKTRRSLRGQAEAKVGVRDALAIQQLDQKVKDALSNAVINGTIAVQPGLDEYKAVIKDGRVAEAQYNKDRIPFEIHNRTGLAMFKFRGQSTEVIGQELAKLHDTEKGQIGEEVIKNASIYAAKLVSERDHDPAAYIRKYNPAIQELEASKIGASPEKSLAIDRQIASAVKRYQGPPPPPNILGNEHRDKGFYQNLPSHQIRILTKEQAAGYAGQLNKGTPDQQVAALASFNARFGDDTRDVAWRDLTSLPKGEAVSQGVQLASLYLGTETARQVLASLKNFDENLKRKGVDASKYREALQSNAEWKAFSDAYAGDATQNAASVAGFGDAIVAFALTMDSKLNERNAVKLATETLLKRKFTYATIGDQNIPFAKWAGPDGREYSDEEMNFSPSVALIPNGPSVGVIPKVRADFESLDFSNVRTKSADGINLFPMAPQGVSEDKMAEYLNTQLATEKMLMPSEDGRGFYVYMRNSISHIPTQLFTKDNRPLFIPYNDADPRRNVPKRKQPLDVPEIFYPAP